MKILRSAVPCRCSVCSRMRTSGAAPDDNDPTEAQTEPVQSSAAIRSSRAESSSSSERAPPLPAAVRLPPELLDSIFAYARPAVPPILFKRVPVSREWRAFTRLALVHSSWRYSAQRALAARVVLRSEEQIHALTRALKLGHLAGDIDEIVLDLKELPDQDDDHDQPHSGLRQSFGPALLDLLQRCGSSKLKTLRCRGFGDACLASLSPQLAARLAPLEAFEYAPIDESAPPTLHQVGMLQLTLPRLKHLAVHPCPRALTRLLHHPLAIELMGLVPMESIAAQIEPDVAEYLLPVQRHQPQSEPPAMKYMRQAMEILAAGLRAALDSLETEQSTRDLLNLNLGLHLRLLEPPTSDSTLQHAHTHAHAHAHAKLESVSLQSIAISPFGLTVFLPSYKTLTSLSLSSVVLCGSSITVLLTLACFAPNLRSFSLHEYPRVERSLQPLDNNQQQQAAAAATTPPPHPPGGGGGGGAGMPGLGPGGIATTDPHFFLDSNSSLTSSHFWLLLRSLTRVESLSLTTSHVFTASPHREEFHLPVTIKKLDLSGGNSEVGGVEVEREGIAWWLDRIEELHRAGQGDDGTGGAASSHDGPERATDTRVDGPFAQNGFDEDSSDDFEFDDDDNSSSSGSDDGSVSTFYSLEDRAPDFRPPSPPPAPSLAPALWRPANNAGTSDSSSVAQLDSHQPHLVQLSLTTRTSPRRLVKGRGSSSSIGKSILRRLDALRNHRGGGGVETRVDWYGLQIVVIEPLDMSRELRIEMSEVPSSWSSGVGDPRA